MTTTPPSVEWHKKPHRIELPLRLQGLRARIEGRPGADLALARATEMDRRAHEIAWRIGQPGLSADQRAQLNVELAGLRLELEDHIARAAGEPVDEALQRSRGAVAALDPAMRQHLAALLRVPCEPQFDALLEMKAAEYLEQGRAFDQVAAQFGFLDGVHLGPSESRGALILTHNGSLVQISAPGAGGDARARRFVYQNIYGGPVPSEGTMALVDPVRLGHPLRSNRMTTSAVRRLRLAVRGQEDWEQSRRTFTHVSSTLMRARPSSPKTMWGADPGWHPAVHRQSAQLVRATRDGRAAREELAELLTRFADPSQPACDAVLEAQIVGLMLHLQGLAVEAGEPGHPLRDVEVFVTDRGERCVVHPDKIRLERPSRPALEIEAASIGVQVIVRGAPLAILDGRGDILVALGDVVWIGSGDGPSK